MKILRLLRLALFATGNQQRQPYPSATAAAMTSTETITVSALHSCPHDTALKPFVQLINDVYDVAEDGMWKEKGMRTNEEEVRSLIEERRLFVATDGSDNDRIVGCVKVERIPDRQRGEFGMLVVDPDYRSRGIGGRLIRASEEWAAEQGYREMQLELLTPRTWDHPSKEFNKKWYARLGYVPTTTEAFEKDYGHLARYLATDCDFTVWLKPLGPKK